MECKKYWEILEVSTLDRMKIEDTRKKLDVHIESCELCREKFNKVGEYDNKTKSEMDNIEVPKDLESNIKLNLVDVEFKSSNKYKKLIITGLFVLIILVIWFMV